MRNAATSGSDGRDTAAGNRHRIRWRNLLSPQKVWKATAIESAALGMVCRHGAPTAILHFLGGLGDELLLTCVAHELRKRNPAARLWQISAAAPLLQGNPDYSLVLDGRHWALRHSNVLARWRRCLYYAHEEVPGVRTVPPREHIVAALCQSAGVEGTVGLRPYCYLTDVEQKAGRLGDLQICIQSVGERTHETWMANKCWYHDRLQEVVDGVQRRWLRSTVVQLGVSADPPLRGVVDRRGKTTLRQTAALLSQATCFVGTQGFLSHLARAVDCRSVIIHGGREHSWQSGYPCNENLDVQLPCSPCWRNSDCEFHRLCMRSIASADVIGAVERAVARYGEPLEIQEVHLLPEGAARCGARPVSATRPPSVETTME